jgi:hypothetical protein
LGQIFFTSDKFSKCGEVESYSCGDVGKQDKYGRHTMSAWSILDNIRFPVLQMKIIQETIQIETPVNWSIEKMIKIVTEIKI